MTKAGASVDETIGLLFRRESGRLTAALVRLLGPSRLALAEDAVQDALVAAMQNWRVGVPDDPAAWLVRVAKNRAIDVLRRERRGDDTELEQTVELLLSSQSDAENQLKLMFAICDAALSLETHVTLILRFLCGFSAAEIAPAFLVDVPTIDRRIHRGRARLREMGALPNVLSAEDVRARQPSIEQALYLLFSEGYHGSSTESPIYPAMCADALHLTELLLDARSVETPTLHALSALFCFNAARLPARIADGVIVPLEEQDRTAWDRELCARGIVHLGKSATGNELTRWHLEAGIAFEHTTAPSFGETNWENVLRYYDALNARDAGPVVALNRAIALTELYGPDTGREALIALEDEPKLARYSFYWAARADVERRAGRTSLAKTYYSRAADLAKSLAERRSYERRMCD